MAKSVNTYFVQMISDIGICPVVKMTDKLHVVQGNGDKLPEVPAITLGSKGISPLTMASAYATFASRGMYCTPIAIESITQKADGGVARGPEVDLLAGHVREDRGHRQHAAPGRDRLRYGPAGRPLRPRQRR